MVYVKMVNSFTCMIINISDSVNMCNKNKRILISNESRNAHLYTYERINK